MQWLRGWLGFTGVAHRLEFVRIWRGAAWYNDSIATAPEGQPPPSTLSTSRWYYCWVDETKTSPGKIWQLSYISVSINVILFGEAVEKIQRAIGQIVPGQRRYLIRIFGLEQACTCRS